MCPTKYLNSNSREDELIIVHYTNDENIDFDKLFKNKGMFNIIQWQILRLIRLKKHIMRYMNT